MNNTMNNMINADLGESIRNICKSIMSINMNEKGMSHRKRHYQRQL